MSNLDRAVRTFCQDHAGHWKFLGILPLREALQAVGGTETAAMLRAPHDELPAPSSKDEDLPRLYGPCRLRRGDRLPARLYGATWQCAFDGHRWLRYEGDPIAQCPTCGVLRELYSAGIGRGHRCRCCDTYVLRDSHAAWTRL